MPFIIKQQKPEEKRKQAKITMYLYLWLFTLFQQQRQQQQQINKWIIDVFVYKMYMFFYARCFIIIIKTKRIDVFMKKKATAHRIGHSVNAHEFINPLN